MFSWQALGLVGPDHFIDGLKLLVKKGTTNERGENHFKSRAREELANLS